METVMSTSEHKYLSDFARKYYDDGMSKGMSKGKAEGETLRARTDLLAVIAAREIPLTDDERARIDACTDSATFAAWLVRAARAAGAKEIFSS
jgi:hypothetical protein